MDRTGVIRRELLSGLKGGNDDDALLVLVEKGKCEEKRGGGSSGFAVIRIAV